MFKNKKFYKLFLIFYINLNIFFITDFIFGKFFSDPPDFLNTSNQYKTNYRNYFQPRTDNLGNLYYTPELINIDVNYSRIQNFPANSYKVMAIGDSFTQGQGVKKTDTWIKQLEKMKFNKQFFGINFGKSGANIKEIKKIFNDNYTKTRTDLVIYGFVLNDPIINSSVPIGMDFDEKNNYGESIGLYFDLINTRTNVFDANRKGFMKFIYDYSNIAKYFIRKFEIKDVGQRTIKYYQNSLDPNINAKGLEETFNIIQQINLKLISDGKKFLIAIFPLFYSTQKNYPFIKEHLFLENKFKKMGINVLDLYPFFSGINDTELWVHPIDQHPNNYAHQIAAKAIYDYIQKINML
jgi:lysophospholipase L1-like esterase